MTELEFRKFCKENNLENKFIITNNCFTKKIDIIGCNKVLNKYIIYYTNKVGTIHIITNLESEYYTFKLLYSIIINDIKLQHFNYKDKRKELKFNH